MIARWVAGIYLLVVAVVFVVAEIAAGAGEDASFGHIWVFLVTAPTSLVLWAMGDIGRTAVTAVLVAAALFQAVVLYLVVRAFSKKEHAGGDHGAQ